MQQDKDRKKSGNEHMLNPHVGSLMFGAHRETKTEGGAT